MAALHLPCTTYLIASHCWVLWLHFHNWCNGANMKVVKDWTWPPVGHMARIYIQQSSAHLRSFLSGIMHYQNAILIFIHVASYFINKQLNMQWNKLYCPWHSCAFILVMYVYVFTLFVVYILSVYSLSFHYWLQLHRHSCTSVCSWQ